jgi:hypothetical protein
MPQYDIREYPEAASGQDPILNLISLGRAIPADLNDP